MEDNLEKNKKPKTNKEYLSRKPLYQEENRVPVFHSSQAYP